MREKEKRKSVFSSVQFSVKDRWYSAAANLNTYIIQLFEIYV